MLRRVALTLTALCVVVCIFGPFTFFLIEAFAEALQRHVYWNADGSNVGYYLQRGAKLLVRHRGYSPDLDDEVLYDPWGYIPIFTFPPVFWFAATRRKSNAGRHVGWFAKSCAVCPFLSAVFVAYLRRDDVLPVFLIIVAVIILIVAAFVRFLQRRPSLAQRREKQGLCPNCAYDLRATPDANGPRLPQCPECGAKTNAHRVPIAQL